jgi:hypothetical protein
MGYSGAVSSEDSNASKPGVEAHQNRQGASPTIRSGSGLSSGKSWAMATSLFSISFHMSGVSSADAVRFLAEASIGEE